MKDLLITIAKAMVDNPDQVKVNVIKGGQTTVLELSVAKDDVGKVIGRQGRNANAIRTILNGASAKIKEYTILEITE